MGAVPAPHRTAVLQPDVVLDAGLDALPTPHTGLGGPEGAVMDDKAVEEGVDRPRFQPVQGAGPAGREVPVRPDAGGPLLQDRQGGGHDAPGLILPRGLEEGDIVLRHDHLQNAPEAEPLLLAEGPEAGRRIPDVAAAGQDEPGIPAAIQAAGAEPVPEQVGELPAIGGGGKDPGALRGQGGGLPRPEEGEGVQSLIAQGLGQTQGTETAVSRAGKIDDHGVSS